MDFELTMDSGGDTRAAQNRLRRLLELEDWFDQVEETAEGLRLRRAHPLIRSGPLRRVRDLASVELVPLGRELRVRGEYVRVGRFLLWFLPGLGLALSALFLALKMPVQFQGIVVLSLSPWIVLGPVMVRSTRRRARRVLEQLILEAADPRDILARTAPANVGQATAPIVVRGDVEVTVAAANSGRATEIFRNLVTSDFHLGHSTGGGFLAAKPWVGLKGGERLPLIGRLEVNAGGGEVRVRADYAGIRFIRNLLLALLLAGLGVLAYFMITEPRARMWMLLGVGIFAPELIILPFVPLMLRAYARSRLEKLLKTAARMAE